MTNLTDNYSGVFLNQNVTPSGSYPWRTNGGGWIYQTSTFPSDYVRGSTLEEQRVPDLSGFQVLVSIDNGYAESASLDYVVQYYTGDTDAWQPVTQGTVIGSHTAGNQVWFDIILPQSIPVPVSLLTTRWRLGVATRTATGAALDQPVTNNGNGTYTIGSETFTAQLNEGVPFPIVVGGLPAYLLQQDLQVTYSIQQGISAIWYVQPTPLITAPNGQGQAYQADGVTPLLGASTTAAVNFRALGLVADGGTDFLGNEYRSYATQTSAGNIATTEGVTPVQGSGQGNYWLSPPMPSRFAVQSLYFDVRPVGGTPQYGLVNNIGNPSFEYDAVGGAPQWWSAFNSGGTVVDQTVHSTLVTGTNATPWTADRFQALHMKYTFTGVSQQRGIISDYQSVVPLTGTTPTPISASVAYDLLAMPAGTTLLFTLLFYDSTQTLLPSPYGTQSFVQAATGIGTLSGSTTIPANAAYVRYLVSALSGATTGTFEAYVDAVQITFTSTTQPYFDGDDVNHQWMNQRGVSPSVQLVEPAIDNNFVVLDGVLIDPITPNIACSVYYSQDDANTGEFMTESDWEQKLWTRVPRVFICMQRQQHSFPDPVHAKYVKLEFTNLQSQSYDAGAMMKPVAYKKFPTWVANFFIGQLSLPSFVASQINVQYDALAFAYDYFLDDLHQGPRTPAAPPSTILSQLTSYFGNAVSSVDPTTLAQIDLAMKPFRQLPASTNPTALSTLLSNILQQANVPPMTTEGGTLPQVDYSTVSSLQRESVVLEQSMPVMYFFLTCRHGYKELLASFEYNRAYFAGIKDVALLRNDYTVASDTPLYIESGGDTANTELSDWTLDANENWVV